jgi:hypothetical protein
VTELKQLAECAINKAWYVPSARSHLPQWFFILHSSA